ncbi:MAG TPA: UDP-N-acetylglucosamine 2-epimerase, partial [Candidatus Dormibacteraeota bacterium]|nr:UDP-N-acetylglucosamine 2-epimerase [Candidatus Dormibacteraeota bacterium]
AAAKLGIPVAHVEAGLRSFDRRMAEELNRVVVDHLSRWLFAPTPTAVANLSREGIVDGVYLVGDLMQDLAARIAMEIRDPRVLEEIGARLGIGLEPGGYLFATVHRAENRAPAALRAWTSLLGAIGGRTRPVILALHPGTRGALAAEGVELPDAVRVVEPQGYRTTLALQLHAAAVLTDSGGVQREAAWLGVPCLVLRDRTEWVEAVEESRGRMVLVGLDPVRARDAIDRLVAVGAAPGQAAERAARLRLASAGAAEAILEAIGDPVPQRT